MCLRYTLSQMPDSASSGVGITGGYKIGLPSAVWAVRSTHLRDRDPNQVDTDHTPHSLSSLNNCEPTKLHPSNTNDVRQRLLWHFPASLWRPRATATLLLPFRWTSTAAAAATATATAAAATALCRLPARRRSTTRCLWWIPSARHQSTALLRPVRTTAGALAILRLPGPTAAVWGLPRPITRRRGVPTTHRLPVPAPAADSGWLLLSPTAWRTSRRLLWRRATPRWEQRCRHTAIWLWCSAAARRPSGGLSPTGGGV